MKSLKSWDNFQFMVESIEILEISLHFQKKKKMNKVKISNHF